MDFGKNLLELSINRKNKQECNIALQAQILKYYQIKHIRIDYIKVLSMIIRNEII